MRIKGLIMVMACLFTVNVKAEDSKGDKEKLQGKWQILSITIENKIIKREDAPKEWQDSFEKKLFIEGERFGQVGYSNAKFSLDETHNPKQITIQDSDGKLTLRGIYTLAGDTLKVCINGDGADVRRPEEFVSKKGTPLLLIELKKVPVNQK